MAFLTLRHVAVTGVSAAVPKEDEGIRDIYAKWGDYDNFFSTTGIQRHRISSLGQCSSDLCAVAAERLLADLHWDKFDVDAIVFVSQTPDYILPATSALIQSRLGLREGCYTLDISLGCSGWVYALSTLGALVETGGIKKALLLAGDTITKLCSPDDKSTYPLFGDAGTATALEYRMEGVSPMYFGLHTDGSGYETIIIRDGGYRSPVSESSFVQESRGEGIVRSRMNLELDGMSVFSFGISKAPQSVKALLEYSGMDKERVDYYIFHQANLFMNEKIRKKLKLESDKVPYSLRDFGNTSCASIPLTMVTQLGDQLRERKLSLLGCGFGVGLSWGSVLFDTDRIVCPDLIEIE